MKTIAAVISENGEIRLPPDVLRHLGVGPHDRVELVVERGEVRIVPASGVVRSSAAGDDATDHAVRRRAALAQISAAFAHESVEEAEQAVAAAIAEVRAEARVARARSSSKE